MSRMYCTLTLAISLLLSSLAFGEEASYTFKTLDFPGASTAPAGINARGQIVGGYSKEGRSHGFLLSKGRFQTIDVPGV